MLDNRVITGLAMAVVRNEKERDSARSETRRSYHQGVVDGLRMALFAILATENGDNVWSLVDRYVDKAAQNKATV